MAGLLVWFVAWLATAIRSRFFHGAALALVGVLATGAALVAQSRADPTSEADRWHVRTLQDRPKLPPAKVTTTEHLIGLRRPHALPQTRLPVERQVYSVVGLVGDRYREPNGDIRGVIAQPGTPSGHWVAIAVPAPFCNSRATQARRRQMGAPARPMIAYACTRVRVTGVVFFTTRPRDWLSPARNRIELHPVLGIECLTG